MWYIGDVGDIMEVMNDYNKYRGMIKNWSYFVYFFILFGMLELIIVRSNMVKYCNIYW